MTSGYRYLPAIYPAVQKSPKDAAKQWEYIYWSISAVVPLTELTTFIVIGSLAYVEFNENRDGLPWKLWATSAGIMPVGWWWVRKVMLDPSNKLIAVANPAPGEVDTKNSEYNQQRTIDLLKEFNAQMSVRMLFPWVVGGLSLWASLGA